MTVLDVAGLAVTIGGRIVVDGLDLRIEPGECVALVGPSGSGKSVTARAILGLSATGVAVDAERLVVAGHDLEPGGRASMRRARRLRGRDVGYVGQEALGALDPLRPVGREVADALRLHTELTARERVGRVREVLTSVGLDPDLATDGRLAGTLSGGMRQRALIAAAVVGRPALVIADEPTTALDAGIAVTVMEVLARVRRDTGAGMLLITHDMGLVRGWADRVVTIGPPAASAGMTDPPAASAAAIGPRTRWVTPPAPEAVPRTPAAPSPVAPDQVIRASALGKAYRARRVVDDVSLAVQPGRTLGVVGASGSGKTTLARMLLGLEVPDAGTVTLDDEPWVPGPESSRRARRHRIAAVVQDPGSTFDERWDVERVLRDAYSGGGRRAREAADSGHGAGYDGDRIDRALIRVGLDPVLRRRAPLTLSGGQRQRLAIARALATDPEVLVLDEPVTALDAAVQDQVLALLEDLQRDTGLAMLFVSHDLDVVRRMSDDVLVMHDGRVVEAGPAAAVLRAPTHPVTAALVDAAERLAGR